jgi:hypothetical protein
MAFWTSPTFWLTAGKFAWDLWSGYQGKKAAEEGGQAAYDAAFANAADLRNFAGFNADAILGAAGRNAEAYMRIGEANAGAIERATVRNLMLYGMQADEEVRRHIIGEKKIAGNIRAAVGASGVQTNTGTPLHFLNSEVMEGYTQRQFMIAKHYQTMWTMAEEGKDRAFITRLTASENAAVIMSNAEAQAAVSLMDAARQAAAMERGGEVARLTGNAQGQAAMIGAIGNGLGTLMTGAQLGAFEGFGSNPTSLASSWSSPNFGWKSSGWAGGTGIGPMSSFQNPGFTQGFTVGGYRV